MIFLGQKGIQCDILKLIVEWPQIMVKVKVLFVRKIFVFPFRGSKVYGVPFEILKLSLNIKFNVTITSTYFLDKRGPILPERRICNVNTKS